MRGDGRIYRLKKRGPDGELHELPTWHIAYMGPKPDGKWGEVRESSHSTDERIAGKLLRDRQVEVANHRAGIRRFVARQDRMTVHELLVGRDGTVENPTGGLLSNYRTRGLPSLPQATANVVHLDAILGSDFAMSVNRGRIERYIAVRRESGVLDSTIDRELEKLSRAYSLAIEDQRLAYKPPIPKLVKMHANARQGFLELAEFRNITGRIEDSDIVDFLEWFYMTGMRPKEIQALTWDGFDRETWVLRLPAKDAKTGKGRHLALTAEWRAIIERRVARRRLDCPFVFHGAGVKILRRVRRAWRSASKGAGLSGRWMYDLRRTAVRNLIRAGVDRSVAKKISGHITDSTFERYDITSNTDIAAAGERLAGYVLGLPSETKGAEVKEFKG